MAQFAIENLIQVTKPELPRILTVRFQVQPIPLIYSEVSQGVLPYDPNIHTIETSFWTMNKELSNMGKNPLQMILNIAFGRRYIPKPIRIFVPSTGRVDHNVLLVGILKRSTLGTHLFGYLHLV